MALYLGSSEKLKVNINNVVHIFNLFSNTPITNGVRLVSSDGCVLKDSNGVYLTVKLNKD